MCINSVTYVQRSTFLHFSVDCILKHMFIHVIDTHILTVLSCMKVLTRMFLTSFSFVKHHMHKSFI